jgi:Cytochrome c554 and c-prime
VTLRSSVPLVAVAAGVIAWSLHTPAQPPAPETLPHPAKSASHLEGIGGCAAAGCHAAPLAPGKAGTEYATWIHDPHGQAASARNGKPYKDVLAHLKGTVYTEDLCLKCHATPTPDGSPLAKDLLDDGIGCEACHGPAEKWRTEHYRNSWKTLDAKQKELEFGFFPTKDLGRRIGKCAECHVGNADKDVNHDLIAAGHPRLNFEYTAYHELLPRHWRDKASEAEPWEDKSKKFGPGFEAQAWLLGQATVAKATVELTAARANMAGRPTHPWPEFTEYGCFACHHDLKPKQGDNLGSTWRQKTRYDDIPPGSLPWATWARPGPEMLIRLFPMLGQQGGNPFADLAGILSRSSPDAKQVHAKAEQAIAKLSQWHDEFAGAPALDAAAARRMLNIIVADGIAKPPRDWDDAAQQYLVMAALYQTLTEYDKSEETPARQKLFIDLRNVLAFPPAGDKQRNSPAEFTPEKYQAALKPFATEFRTPEAP